MPDEPTLGELGRRLDSGITDLRDDIRELAGRLDSKVDQTALGYQQQAQDERHTLLVARVQAIEDARVKEAAQRAADRRLILTALVVPVLLVLLQVYLASRGQS